VRAIAGGGGDFSSDNIPGLQADVGFVNGLAVSNDSNVVYFIDQTGGAVRFINVSAGNVTICSQTIGSRRIGTLGSNPVSLFNGLSVHPTTGDVYVIDVAAGVNKVFKIACGGTLTPVAGNGMNTTFDTAFTPGPASNVSLLQPRALKFEANGNLLVA